MMTLACASSSRMPPDGLDALHHRHPQVEQDDVGAMPVERFDALESVGGLGDDLEVDLLVDDVGHAGAQQRVVVDDQHAGPRRLRVAAAGASTSLCGMAGSRNREGRRLPRQHDLGARARRRHHGERRADPIRALLHARQAEAAAAVHVVDAAAVVGHRDPQRRGRARSRPAPRCAGRASAGRRWSAPPGRCRAPPAPCRPSSAARRPSGRSESRWCGGPAPPCARATSRGRPRRPGRGRNVPTDRRASIMCERARSTAVSRLRVTCGGRSGADRWAACNCIRMAANPCVSVSWMSRAMRLRSSSLAWRRASTRLRSACRL